MASAKKRARRRTRRAARVRRPDIKRYTVYCGKTDDYKRVPHILYVTEKGDIFFKYHSDISLAALAAEGGLMHRATGCYYVAARIAGPAVSASKASSEDNASTSAGLKKFLHELDDKKRRRETLKEVNTGMQMKPMKESLLYRRELLLARMIYRIDTLVLKLQYNSGCKNPEPGSAREPYGTHCLRYVPGRNLACFWDY